MKTVQHKAFRILSELDIAYAPDAGESATSSFEGSGPHVGQRAPNAAIARHLDMFDLIGGYGFTVIALSRKPLERDALSFPAAALDTLRRAGVKAHLVTRLAVGRDPRAVFVSSSEVFTAYGLHQQDAQAVYLVRPDGYVAWRANGLDLSGCQRFLVRFGLDASA